MKKEIHPEYKNCMVTCSCGNTFETKSTTNKIDVEICSACHPFFTGKQKLVDTAGRVDRFRSRLEASQKLKNQTGTKKKETKIKTEEIEKLNEKIEEISEELQEELIEIKPEENEKNK